MARLLARIRRQRGDGRVFFAFPFDILWNFLRVLVRRASLRRVRLSNGAVAVAGPPDGKAQSGCEGTVVGVLLVRHLSGFFCIASRQRVAALASRGRGLSLSRRRMAAASDGSGGGAGGVAC